MNRKEVPTGKLRPIIVEFDAAFRRGEIREDLAEELKAHAQRTVNKCRNYANFPGEDIADHIDLFTSVATCADNMKDEAECEKAHKFVNDMLDILYQFSEIGDRQIDEILEPKM